MSNRSERVGDAYFVGVDVGGTATKAGRWTVGADALQAARARPTGADRPREAVLADLVSEVRALVDGAPGTPLGIGVGLPATLSPAGEVEVLPNFAPGWRGVAVAQELARAIGLPAVAVNDARAFTLAEARLGAAVGAASVFGVTLGTGVGGGLVLDGELHLGATGNAGEFGHHVHDPHGPRCGCGGHGCLETYASAPALVASVMRAFVQGAAPALVRLADGRFEAVTPALIDRAAADGDAVCREAIARAARVLGVGLANVATLTGVEAIVVGGGMAGLGDAFWDELRDTLRAYAPTAAPRLPRVVRARLGGEAGALGAALHAADVLARSAREAPPGAGRSR